MDEIFPIMDVENDCIISKQGDVTIAFKVDLPEIFTLSDHDYATLHQSLVKALKLLPKYSVFHKQDWFLEKTFQPIPQQRSKSFLAHSADQYFTGRPYVDHSCYIYLTKKANGRKVSTSMFSNLLRPSIVPNLTINQRLIQEFTDAAGQFHRVLEDSGFFRLQRLTTDQITSDLRTKGLLENYCFLSEKDPNILIKDVQFSEGLQIGDQHVQLYTLGDAADLPHLCSPHTHYEKYSTDRTKFSIGFASTLGQLLNCDHIYNQYVFIDDGAKTIQRLETKRLRLQSLSAYSRENLLARDATNEFLNEAIGNQRLPVKAHFNIQVWTPDADRLKDLKKDVSAALAKMDAIAKLETHGAAQIWWSGIPGNAGDFPTNETFDTFLEQALCFIYYEGSPKSVLPHQGVRFCDRLSGKPLYVDMLDQPRELGISSNMGMLVCGTSGGGKSMTVNHILHTLYTQGAHCVVVDIGGSYKGLCELVKGYYFTYEESRPIQFNPFYLPEGQILDTEKKESLKSLLISLWKQENENFNRSEYVALSNALAGYYQRLEEDQSLFPCFNTFYEYLQKDYIEILKHHNVKDKDFDIDNFLYVLRPFYKSGEFDFLLNATENLDILHQPFVVIELDNLRDHPVLFGVVTLLVMEMFISKMRKLKGTRKVLAIDEAWSAIAKSGMAAFLKYAFKTIRKFNGVPIVITQELDDLVSSPIIKDAIINNADIKVLMDMRKFVNKFDKLQDTLGMSEKAKNILLSVNKDEREIFIDIGGQINKVYKNELCPHEYFAFTTEGKERVKVMDYAEKYGSMEKGIEKIVEEKRKRA